MKNFTSYFSYKSLSTLYSGLLVVFLPFFYSPIEFGYYSITIIIQSLAGLLTVGIPIRLNTMSKNSALLESVKYFCPSSIKIPNINAKPNK